MKGVVILAAVCAATLWACWLLSVLPVFRPTPYNRMTAAQRLFADMAARHAPTP